MSSTDLSKYNNSWYKEEIGASRLKQVVWYYANIIFFKNPYFPFNGMKVFFLKLFGAQMGKKVVIKPSVNIKYPWKLKISDNVWIGEKVWIDNLEFVVIGRNVCISQGAMLLTGNHDYSSSTFNLIVRPITIDDGVWIGAKSVVCPGVHAFTHAVLSVQSVATKDLEAYGIYQGNPATRVRERIIEEKPGLQ